MSGELAADEVYGVAYRSEGLDQQGYDSVSELVDLEQVGEHDLALARIGFAIEPRLTLAESPRHGVREYLSTLVAGLERKNAWTLAERAGEVGPDGTQRLLVPFRSAQEFCAQAL